MTTVWPYRQLLVTRPQCVDGVGECIINQVNQMFPLRVFSVSEGGKSQLFFLGKEVRGGDWGSPASRFHPCFTSAKRMKLVWETERDPIRRERSRNEEWEVAWNICVFPVIPETSFHSALHAFKWRSQSLALRVWPKLWFLSLTTKHPSNTYGSSASAQPDWLYTTSLLISPYPCLTNPRTHFRMRDNHYHWYHIAF